jgi:hypothetical protein
LRRPSPKLSPPLSPLLAEEAARRFASVADASVAAARKSVEAKDMAALQAQMDELMRSTMESMAKQMQELTRSFISRISAVEEPQR